MKLDDASKVAVITSTVVGVILSIAGYFASRQIEGLESELKKIHVATQSFEQAKAEFSSSARLTVEYITPLAQDFANRVAIFRPDWPEDRDRFVAR